MGGDVLLVVVVVVALGFDFTNGFHDTANSIATAVGKTVGKGLIDTGLATQQTVLAALVGAIAWNLLTWWFGLPSSSSHALIGGLIGAALVQSGSSGVEWHDIAHKVLIPAVFAPAIAFAAAFALL